MNELFNGNFPMNANTVGILMKEAVRRALVVIRTERVAHEVIQKTAYDGESYDVVTSADKAAQEIYVKLLKECFPTCAIIGEENELRYQPENCCGAYFTLDPLDGTKAFTRRQSHGVGTMIALVYEREVIAAYIGDVNTQEIYGYRPDSSKVHRITEFESATQMGYTRPFDLVEGGNNYILLRDFPEHYSSLSRKFMGMFGNLLVDGSSIGTWAARLWKREVAGLMIPPSHETPWDSTPVFGISQKLGYLFFRSTPEGWEPVSNMVQDQVYRRESDLFIIHREDYPRLQLHAIAED